MDFKFEKHGYSLWLEYSLWKWLVLTSVQDFQKNLNRKNQQNKQVLSVFWRETELGCEPEVLTLAQVLPVNLSLPWMTMGSSKNTEHG